MNIEIEVKKIIEKPINELGYNNVSVSYKKENGEFYLHVLIDKDDAISLDDIVKVNDLVSDLLDKSDIISNKYILDVSSYGAEKILELNKLEKYVGKYVNIHLVNPYKGENYLQGNLLQVSKDEIVIELKNKARLNNVTLKRGDIDKARLAIKF